MQHFLQYNSFIAQELRGILAVTRGVRPLLPVRHGWEGERDRAYVVYGLGQVH